MSEQFPEIGDIETFVENINDGLARVGIDRNDLSMMDHVCYRVETKERYDELLQSFRQAAKLIDESDVAGRLIATFELDEPLEVAGWKIPYLELPQPKEGSPYAEGLEHAELVIIGSLGRFAAKYASLPFERKSMSKLINPELGLKYEGISVKFHEQQLGAVVRIEQRLTSEGKAAL